MDDEEDDVLMGTTRIAFGGTDDFNATSSSVRTGMRPGLGSTLPNTGEFSRDSLGSGPRSTSGGNTPVLGPGASATPTNLATRGQARKPSPFSPVQEHGSAQDASLETEEEDESIPPPTYDSLLGTGSNGGGGGGSAAEDSSLRDSVLGSFTAASFAEEGSEHMHNVAPEFADADRPQWSLGRAAMESIEMAAALEVYVTAVRLESHHARIYPQVMFKP